MSNKTNTHKYPIISEVRKFINTDNPNNIIYVARCTETENSYERIFMFEIVSNLETYTGFIHNIGSAIPDTPDLCEQIISEYDTQHK